MEISAGDFSAPIRASVFKFCVHLQVVKVYCVNVNKDANPYFAFFFKFSFFPSVALIYTWTFFSVKDFSATTGLRALKFSTKLDSDELYCVTKRTATYCLLVPLFVHFLFSNGNFPCRFLSSYWNQCFQILCTTSGRQSVLCK